MAGRGYFDYQVVSLWFMGPLRQLIATKPVNHVPGERTRFNESISNVSVCVKVHLPLYVYGVRVGEMVSGISRIPLLTLYSFSCCMTSWLLCRRLCSRDTSASARKSRSLRETSAARSISPSVVGTWNYATVLTKTLRWSSIMQRQSQLTRWIWDPKNWV